MCTNVHVPFLSLLFFPFLPAYRFRDTSFGLLGVPCRFRAQIFTDTPLNVQRRSRDGTPSQNLGSPQICLRQIFAYWYAGSAFTPRVFLLPVLPSCFISDFYDFFALNFCKFDIGVFLPSTLSNGFLRKGTRVKSVLSIAVCKI